jgi:hypothetical protein
MDYRFCLDSLYLYNMKTKYCKFGCGKIATFQLKNGNWICESSSNKCDVMRLKNSTKNKGIPKYSIRGENHPRPMLGKKAWNSGKTKETDERVRRQSEMRKGITPSCGGRASTKEKEELRKKKISEKMKLVGGGYRKGSGRGKKGWYKGYWCDSSWELAWVIYQLEHGIEFSRNEEQFKYVYGNVVRHYIPDFKILDTYIEIKGYDNDQWQNKLSQFPHKLQILYEDDMKPMLEYAYTKYGKHFIELYEESKTAGVQSSP